MVTLRDGPTKNAATENTFSVLKVELKKIRFRARNGTTCKQNESTYLPTQRVLIWVAEGQHLIVGLKHVYCLLVCLIDSFNTTFQHFECRLHVYMYINGIWFIYQ